MSETIIRNSPAFASETLPDTPEKRIAEVAWRWNRQYSYLNKYLLRGFTPQEIAAGNALGGAMEAEWENNRRAYGDPSYGSWPTSAKSPIKDMVRAMASGDTRLYADWSANMAATREWWNIRSREERAAQYPQRAYYDFGQSWDGLTDSLRVSIMSALMEAGCLPKAYPPEVKAPKVSISQLAYEMSARAEKARTMARVLHQGHVSSGAAAQMTQDQWKLFHAGLKAKGILGCHSTVPSAETIAMTILEMRKLERIAPRPVAVKIRRRIAA